MRQQSKSDAAKEIIEKFPKTSKKELGKILCKLKPVLFKDEEDARGVIRYVTGANGKKRIQYGTHKDIYKGLPKGIHNDYSSFDLKPGKWGVLSDVHIPSHDEGAVELALAYFKKKGVTNILLNGDILDCYQVSDHVRDPSVMQLKDELDMIYPWLSFLQESFDEIVYKLGNHEERLERYLIQKAAALYGMKTLTWNFHINARVTNDPKTNEIVDIEKRVKKIPVIGNKRVIKAGKLSIVHGHEFGRQQVFNPVNAARGYFMRAKANVLGGDKHSTSEHIESDINGKVIGAWSTGCLCDLHPQYLPINRWNLGFAVVEHDGEEFEVSNLKIINGSVR